MVAPALNKIFRDLGMTSEVEAQITFSIVILAYAVGPLFPGPLSEVFGRAYVLLVLPCLELGMRVCPE